jgi:ribosomal protein S12 methylthiotransferase accessory factor
MIETPRFAAHLHAHVIPNEGVVFSSQAGYAKVKGRLFELVTPLIDGRRSVDDIVDSMTGRLSAAEVFYAIAMLEQHGYVRESEHAPASRPE